MLLATKAGLGDGETPVFPVSIFNVKDGVNYKEGDPNYDLFKLAIKVSAERLFPKHKIGAMYREVCRKLGEHSENGVLVVENC